jgi:cytochrome c biogenesis protein CcmG/thiol:disulfide interchange protein DsbE
MKRWIALAPLVVLALLALLFATYGLRHDPTYIPATLVGKPFPDISLPPLQGGQPVRVKSQLSGPTFVNVFFSTCVPCMVEAPALAAMKAQGARIVGIAYKEDPAASQGFLVRYGDPYASVLADRSGRAAIELGVSGAPETFLVGADGIVIDKFSGALQPADAEAMMERAAGKTATNRPG